MKTMRFLLVAVASFLAATASMAQNGFNYQAVIRDADGNLLAGQNIALRITLTSENADTTYYQEMQTKLTNAYGVVSIVVGEGTVLSGYFSKVPWNSGNVYMKTEFDPTGVGTDDLLVTVGTTRLQSVPVAEYAKKTSEVENPKNIKIQATNETGEEEALFEVKDKDGNVVFAVYNDGVRVYVDDTKPNSGGKAAKSGFAVAGRSGKTGEANTYFAVNDEGTRVYVDDEGPNKAAKAKFAVASVGKSKTGESLVDNYLVVNKQGTKVYVDGNENVGDKAAKATFAVASVRSKKDTVAEDFFVINNEGTKVYVDDTASGKAAKATFAVAGKSGKADNNNLFVVNQSGTKVYVDEADNKAAKATFAVAGKSGKSVGDNYFVINDEGTKVYVDGVNGQKAAKATFAVASVRNGKAETAEDFFLINKDGTKVFIDEETNNKAAKATFAVASVKKGKDGQTANPNYLIVDSDSTRVYIEDGSNGKAAKSGFAVAGKSGGKDGETTRNLFNIDLAKSAEVLNGENRVYWYPAEEKNAFMAGNLKVDNANDVGTNSFNAGYQNKASGDFSQAFGYKSEATGETSIAIGNQAKATGKSSFAFGENTTAAGESSVAIGVDAQTGLNAKNSFVFGKSAIATKENGYAFGDGAKATGNNSYALGALAEAKGSYSYALGSGVIVPHWNSQGQLIRIDTMLAPKASGAYSYAFGPGAKTSASYAFAFGYNTTASEYKSTAIGDGTTASGQSAIAMGRESIASSDASSAMGGYTTASGAYSTAMGYKTKASQYASTAMGYQTTASGYISTTMGCKTTASGYYSTATGYGTTAKSYGEFVVGSFNTDYTVSQYGLNNPSSSDRVFVIGNGGSLIWNNSTSRYDTTRSDAMIVYKSGSSQFGGSVYPMTTNKYNLGTSATLWAKVYATGGVQTTSDQRLKTNIKPLERALDKVLTLNGVTYNWRVAEFPEKNFDNYRHVGVLAQELEAVLPEAVETGEDGYKSVNYAGITPLLIEAIKEQQQIINTLQSEKDAQQKEIEELKAQMKEILEKLK